MGPRSRYPLQTVAHRDRSPDGRHTADAHASSPNANSRSLASSLQPKAGPSLRRRRYRPKPRVSAAAKPRSATLGNASPQSVCTPTGFHNGTMTGRENYETPLGFGCWWSLNPGCAARPWALFFNRYAVPVRLGYCNVSRITQRKLEVARQFAATEGWTFLTPKALQTKAQATVILST